MNKRTLLKSILAALQEELQTFTRAAMAARAEATDPQSRAENKYDTRGLEASYLAAGQARQVAELEAAITAFTMLPARAFAPGEGIGLAHVRTIVRNLGGDITVRSELDAGTTFSILLPPDLSAVQRSTAT